MRARSRLIGMTCLAAAALVLAGCRTNPVTGGRELSFVGEQQEMLLGHQTHPNVIFMYDGEYHDPELNRYLGTIVMRIHSLSHRRDMSTEFTMLNTSVVNAFATPGHVYATRGFLAKLQNEAQFAAVMGHEMAHVTAGHTAKQMTNSILTGIVVGAAGAAADTGESSALGKLAVGAGQAGVVLLGLSYSREQERQADRVGTYYMAMAGYDPLQAIEMQKLLASLSGRQDTVLDKYLSTHPGGQDRLGEIEAVIDEKGLLTGGYVQGDGRFADRWNRRLAHLREVSRAYEPYDRAEKLLSEGKNAEALAAVNEALAMRTDQAPFHTLKGDVLLKLGRAGEAHAAYQNALNVDTRFVPANIGLGKIALAANDFTGAEGQFAIAAHGFPGSPQSWFGLGLALYHQNKYADAIPPLERTAGMVPAEPMPHFVLARCYDETGRTADAAAGYQRALDAGLQGEEAQVARQRRDLLAAYLAPAQ